MALRGITLFLAWTLIGGQAEAATIAGKISSIFLSSSNNYAFRIIIGSTINGCAGGFAYLNVGDSGNYQAYVASLTSAYLAGKTVDLVYITGSGGFCSITEFQVKG